MRILQVSHLYAPSIGGNQAQTQGLSDTLSVWGEDVTVFTTNALLPGQLTRFDPGFTPLPKCETIGGVTVRRFTPWYLGHKLFATSATITNPLLRGIKATRLRDSAMLLRSRGPFVPQMLWAVRQLKPDVIQVHGGYPATTYFCYLAKRYFGYPLVIRPTTHVSQGWHTHPMQLEFYRTADLLIVSTEFERGVLIGQGLPEGKIVRIGNGLDPTPFLQGEGAPFRRKYHIGNRQIVAFVGRRAQGKGIEPLIEAMRHVWKKMPSPCLVLAGNRDSEHAGVLDERINAVRREGIGQVVDIDDFDEEEKAQIFAACDLFVMTSNTDSFGIVYLEAWASGKPVVACRKTPQETIITEGKDGSLVDYGNVPELARTILNLLADDNLRGKMGHAGRQKVLASYTWETVASQTRDEYHKLIESRR